MTDKDKGTFFCELGRHVSRFCIGPRDMEPAFNEDIGKGTHAGAANADKMNVFDLIQIDHAVIPPYPHRSWQGLLRQYGPPHPSVLLSGLPDASCSKDRGPSKAVPSRYTKSLP